MRQRLFTFVINYVPLVTSLRVRQILNLLILFMYRLRPIDVEFMKRLDKCVNIVPVIAKADTLTVEEREAFRRRVSSNSDRCALN